MSTNYNLYHCYFHVPRFFLSRSMYFSLFSFSVNFTLWSTGTSKSTIRQVLFFLFIITRSVRLAMIRCSIWISNSQMRVYASCSPGQIMGWTYTIRSMFQISISRTILCESPYPPIRVKFYIISVLICCTRLLCDWSFRLYHHITYICCFVTSYPFFLWYSWSLWRSFELLWEIIQFIIIIIIIANLYHRF